MTRKQEFHELICHPWFSRLYKTLNPTEIIQCERFLDRTQDLISDEYVVAIDRWFMDKPKPKNWLIMTELVGKVL